MIRPTERLHAFEHWYAQTHLAPLSYEEALEIFAALWRHAREVNPDFPGDWRSDIEADIRLARALNALPE
jgi:hypothetical protein